MHERSHSVRAGQLVSFGLLLTAACASNTDSPDSCETGHCDGLPFLRQLEGREDPIATWMRPLAENAIIDAAGVYHADRAGEVAPANDPLFYGKLLDGLIAVQGCRGGSIVTHAISDDLVTGSPEMIFPRIVATVCADDDLATNAFVATLGEPAADRDLALDELELFAWDARKQQYFFYATSSSAEGEIQIEVDPARCSRCHTTPLDVDPVGMPRIPIMNELTKPWSHWNAGDGNISESFQVPADLLGKPNWERFGATASAASRLEKVIRDANAQRVGPARGKQLFKPAKLEEAMGLIRPVFCDEQVNYVTELATGELAVDAVVSGGIKGAFRSIQAAWPWGWFNNDTIQLPAASEDERLFMMPVRGMAELTFEAQLQGVLSPAHILAVRALDWKQPVFSRFRCDLWGTALTAFQVDPPRLSGRNRDAVKVLFEEIMNRAGMSTRGLASGRFIALDDATDTRAAALRDVIQAGNVPLTCEAGFCELDATGFGELLDAHVTSLTGPARRVELVTERDRRVCKVHERVEPAGAHADHGAGPRIGNDPSFLRIRSDSTAVSTTPANCP